MKSSRSRVSSRCAQNALHTGGVAQIKPEDLEAVSPVGEVGLGGVASGGVPGESGRHDQVRARAQQLDPGLVADLHPPTGQERDPPAQVRRLGALGEVEVAARRAELVVEVMDLGVGLLADVAGKVLGELGSLDAPSAICPRGVVVGGREDGRLAKTRIPVSARRASSRSCLAALASRRSVLVH